MLNRFFHIRVDPIDLHFLVSTNVVKTSENKASHLVASTEVELELVAKVRAPLLRAALASVRGADAGLVQLRLPLRASRPLKASAHVSAQETNACCACIF